MLCTRAYLCVFFTGSNISCFYINLIASHSSSPRSVKVENKAKGREPKSSKNGHFLHVRSTTHTSSKGQNAILVSLGTSSLSFSLSFFFLAREKLRVFLSLARPRKKRSFVACWVEIPKWLTRRSACLPAFSLLPACSFLAEMTGKLRPSVSGLPLPASFTFERRPRSNT